MATRTKKKKAPKLAVWTPAKVAALHKQMTIATALPAGLIAELIKQFGPVLAQLILKWLMNKQGSPGVRRLRAKAFAKMRTVSVTDPGANGTQLASFLAMLLEQIGPKGIDQLANFLLAQGDWESKMLGMALKNYGDKIIQLILDWLNSAAAPTALLEAMSG